MNNGQLLFRVSFVLTHIYVDYNYFVHFDQSICVNDVCLFIFLEKSRFLVLNLGENGFVIVHERFFRW